MTVYQWLEVHPAIMSALSVGVYHIASAFVGSLEMPDATSGKFYRFFFAFANRIAANYSRASASTGVAGIQPPKEGN
jgi:hypothetical protein